MKKFLSALVIIVSTMTFAQQTEKDGKCDLPKDYQEPKPEKRLQSSLKRVNATINDLRKHIAVENDCNKEDVVFLRISEQLGNGMYSVCVKGQEMKYKRMGSVFMKNSENPFDAFNSNK
ncbi:hypothetical protein [Chryseobacterium lathyri]|uniref:Uncharacterized protein n=1 Tax=Chryseobacterium lathyri TaxID=395933 RepID=A0ABT9STC3_9FLAO|nr:hypothetical protein [Chryseobacterium lathyri]MDP9961660.1 hypothetical protein [Chryseobacterium lathyri]